LEEINGVASFFDYSDRSQVITPNSSTSLFIFPDTKPTGGHTETAFSTSTSTTTAQSRSFRKKALANTVAK
jgi:hypothetical protein